MISPTRSRDLVSGGLTALLAALEGAQRRLRKRLSKRTNSDLNRTALLRWSKCIAPIGALWQVVPAKS